MKKSFNLIFLFLISFLFFSCQTTDFSTSGKCHYYVDCIDLDSENLEIKAKLSQENPFDLMDFVDSENLTIAINTTPWEESDSAYKILGVYKFDDEVLANPVEKYSALGFYRNSEGKLRAKIIKNQTSENLSDLNYAFGGYYTILENSKINTFEKYYHSRSACGTDQSGRFLYFFVCTSTLLSDNSGMTYEECAEILKDKGCTDALQFDGGHSSAMYSEQTGFNHSRIYKKIPAAFGFSTTN